MQPVLKVDLSNRSTTTINIPKEWSRDYLGGASLGARMLYDDLTPDLEPLSPEAPLLFLNGPLSGSLGPAMGRFVICAKSPATGLWSESNCGGFWGPELRKAGFDGIWLSGRSDTPVYLWINDEHVEFRDASHLWGLNTYKTQQSIENELQCGKISTAVIGFAGENGLPFSLILCDHGRVAGRTGVGAVMGSKNLKAISVHGTHPVPVTQSQIFAHLRSAINRELKSDNFTRSMRELGSSGGADYFEYLGEAPKKYFQAGTFPDIDQVSGAAMAETILTNVSACHGCVIACGRVVDIGDKTKRKGPEYETIMGFGPNLLIKDLKAITRFGELCDEYGMDTISLSNTIGLAFSMYERDIISEQETGGLRLEWGNKDVVEELIHKTAHREGFGAFLAEGARALGKRYGVPNLAVHVNGLEVPYHDPRGASGMALVYATSPRGACHNQSDYFIVEIGRVETSLGMKEYSRQGGSEKAENVAKHQNWTTLCNSLVMCLFANVPPESLLAFVNEGCQLDLTLDELLQIGERAWNLKRVINQKLGLSLRSNALPEILMQPLLDGGAAGYTIDFEAMLEAYFIAREWDVEHGCPTNKKLTELGLEWLIEAENYAMAKLNGLSNLAVNPIVTR